MSTCRALIPVDTMDIQALKVIELITRDKSTHQRAITSIKVVTDYICIEGALSILDAFGYVKTPILIGDQKWVANDLKNERYFPDLQGRMAHETPVFAFWGGPPTKLNWYEGTLKTLMDDRVLYEIRVQGADEIAKLIGIDLEELANVSAPTSVSKYQG